MPYANLVEGDRIWDSATDGTIYAADFNELMDQLKAALSPRVVSVPLAAGYDANTIDAVDDASNEWHLNGVADPPYWLDDATEDSVLVIPFQVHDDWIITQVKVWINHAVGSPLGGSMSLVKWDHSTGLTLVLDITNGTTNPWDVDGVVTAYERTAQAITVDGNAQYGFRFIAPSTDCADAKVLQVQFTRQINAV